MVQLISGQHPMVTILKTNSLNQQHTHARVSGGASHMERLRYVDELILKCRQNVNGSREN